MTTMQGGGLPGMPDSETSISQYESEQLKQAASLLKARAIDHKEYTKMCKQVKTQADKRRQTLYGFMVRLSGNSGAVGNAPADGQAGGQVEPWRWAPGVFVTAPAPACAGQVFPVDQKPPPGQAFNFNAVCSQKLATFPSMPLLIRAVHSAWKVEPKKIGDDWPKYAAFQTTSWGAGVETSWYEYKIVRWMGKKGNETESPDFLLYGKPGVGCTGVDGPFDLFVVPGAIVPILNVSEVSDPYSNHICAYPTRICVFEHRVSTHIR